MLKKKIGIFTVGVLMVGLVACGAGNDTANDGNNRMGTSSTSNQVGTYGNQTDTRERGEDKNGVDNVGPLVEDYKKEPGDLNFTGTNRNRVNIQNNNRGNGIDNDQKNDHRKVNINSKSNKNDNDDNLSSYRTNQSSNEYPHTRAILIREAQYKYLPMDGEDARKNAEELKRRLEQRFAQGNQGQEQDQGQEQNQNQQPEQATPQQNEQQATPKQEQPPATPNQQPTNQDGAGQQEAQQPEQGNQKQGAPAGIGEIAQRVIDLTNEQRKQNGLPALQADPKLSGVAQKKSEDMRQNNYFSHTSPTYGSPFDMMRDFGVSYKTAGENIAQGQPTPEAVVQAWMDSPGHRENILKREFTHIGVGYDASGHHWTQMFIGK